MEERTGIDRVRAITRYSCVYTSILCQASILHASQTRQNTVAHSMRSDASLIRRWNPVSIRRVWLRRGQRQAFAPLAIPWIGARSWRPRLVINHSQVNAQAVDDPRDAAVSSNPVSTILTAFPPRRRTHSANPRINYHAAWKITGSRIVEPSQTPRWNTECTRVYVE